MQAQKKSSFCTTRINFVQQRILEEQCTIVLPNRVLFTSLKPKSLVSTLIVGGNQRMYLDVTVSRSLPWQGFCVY